MNTGPGFLVGASLSGENKFNVLIGMEEWCFDPHLDRLTVTQLPCCTGSSGTKQCTALPELVASKAVSTASHSYYPQLNLDVCL